MHTLILKFREFHFQRTKRFVDFLLPHLALLNITFVCLLSTYAFGKYLGLPTDPLGLATYAAVVFLTYIINRYTDREDEINDPRTKRAFNSSRYLLFFTITLVSGLFVVSAVRGYLSWYFFLLIVIGILYSIPIIPVYHRRDNSIAFARLKSFGYLKSFSVGITMGSSFFLYHFLSPVNNTIIFTGELFSLFFTGIFIVFIAANFCDIRDYYGDKISGVKTFATLLGPTKTIWFTYIIPAFAWSSLSILLFRRELISAQILLFTLLNMLFPIFYYAAFYNRRIKLSPSFILILADTSMFFYGAGLLLIAEGATL